MTRAVVMKDTSKDSGIIMWAREDYSKEVHKQLTHGELYNEATNCS